MIDAHSKMVLQNLVRRDSRSLLQYICESFPWITAAELACFQEMVREEVDNIAAIARFLGKQRLSSGTLGAYPMTFTNINYISLDHLLPLLIDNQRRRIAELERELPGMGDAGSRQLAEDNLTLKRRHLQAYQELLQGLAKKQPAAVSA